MRLIYIMAVLEKPMNLSLSNTGLEQDMFWPIPGLISFAGVTGKWGGSQIAGL